MVGPFKVVFIKLSLSRWLQIGLVIFMLKLLQQGRTASVRDYPTCSLFFPKFKHFLLSKGFSFLQHNQGKKSTREVT